jgi:formylglycine-generating enzyme required for sulfatase activity
MKEDKRITEKDVVEAEVRLKPLFGITPGRYLAVIYALALAVILFMLLLYPGLRKPGAFYRIESDPPGSAITLDGAYRASTPATIFLPAGRRELMIDHPFFVSSEQPVQVRARIFGTLFHAKVSTLRFDLEADLAAGSILSEGMKEFSWWAMAGQPSEAYQIPMVLSEHALAWTAISRSMRESIRPVSVIDFTGAALSYTANPQSARDALRAAVLVAGGSAALTPASLGLVVDAVWKLLANDPALLSALAAVLPADIRAELEATAFHRSLVDASNIAAAKAAGTAPAPQPHGRLQAAGGEYIEFPAGETVIRTESGTPAVVQFESFALAAMETTVAQFRDFIRSNPRWSVAEAKGLQAAGLVDAMYLEGFDSASDGQPVRYVSRHAAAAYAEWLSARAPSGYRFSLPTEAQWNRAAEASASAATRPDAAALFAQGRTGPSPAAALRTDAAGFRGLLGSVWEWCADSFSVHPGAGVAGRREYPGYDGLVRGGSWANRADLVNLNSRGPMTPESCNAYTGFRLALVPVKD